ncbi:hypothetical protein [Brevibacillus massiliensis]|uniref:hypothetical protein n=1 Tax=Brevibacillus massiliensis TaxID=1118054 RepID=UPI00031117BE|nr:hypothetical protein [Brevibacillus massiliensis]
MQRLKKTDYLLTYMIIITFASFIGGFFLGASVMKGKIYAEQAVQSDRGTQNMYPDKDFITYYYNVYEPMQKFKAEYFRMNGQQEADTSQKLQKLAKKTLQEVEKASVPETSPLLLQAKHEYIRSLKAYTEDDGSSDFDTAWLRADADMYKAVATWEQLYVTKKSTSLQVPKSISFSQWKEYPFHYRNYISAEYLYQTKKLVDYRPVDLTAKLDSVIANDQAASLGWTDVPFAIRVLTTTDAVRTGDFSSLRKQVYPKVAFPEMPLFTE